MAVFSTQQVSALVLAAGRGSRMGGVDKGLQVFQGRPLVQHAIERLQDQCAHVMINANRHLDQYAAWGHEVWPDDMADFAGPLAGFMVGLQHCRTPFLLIVPCDSPFFPLDLALRLGQALIEQDADLAVAVGAEVDPHGHTVWRPQPVFCLLRSHLLNSLTRFMQVGGRKIDAWTAQHPCAWARFDQALDDPKAFANFNTLSELQQHEGRP